MTAPHPPAPTPTEGARTTCPRCGGDGKNRQRILRAENCQACNGTGLTPAVTAPAEWARTTGLERAAERFLAYVKYAAAPQLRGHDQYLAALAELQSAALASRSPAAPTPSPALDGEASELLALVEEWKGRADDAGRLSRGIIRLLSAHTAALAEAEARADMEAVIADCLTVCGKRGWSLHWTARGAYLHLEASELIEAWRGKGTSTVAEEAGDVLLVLFSILGASGTTWQAALDAALAKKSDLHTRPRYANEEFSAALASASPAQPEAPAPSEEGSDA